MATLARICSLLTTIAIAFAALGLVLMTVIVIWQVFGRYVLNDTPNWSERSSIFLMNWYILFAAAAGVRERFHLGLVYFQSIAGNRMQKVMEATIHIAVGSFGMSMVVYGAELAKTTWTHTIPTLGISNGLSYLPLPIAGVLITLFSVEHLVNLACSKDMQENVT